MDEHEFYLEADDDRHSPAFPSLEDIFWTGLDGWLEGPEEDV